MMLDEVDRKLVALTSSGFPVVRDPYGRLAEQLGLSAGEVVERLRRLRAGGVIRRVAAILDQRRVGLVGNMLVAWAVPEGRADEVGEHLARRREVTHCYLRAPAAGWPYNLYAMVHGPSEESCRQFVEQVTGELKLEPAALLPTVRELKRAPLPLGEG
jgi:DNA-binding Lrp family transcriptional regulator